MITKRLLFLVCGFADGGIETTLVRYLCAFADDKRYEITLAIDTDMGDIEVYRHRLPHTVRVVHLVTESWLCRHRILRHRHQLGALAKVACECFLTPVERMLKSRRLSRLVRQADYVIDFDTSHTAFLRHCPKPIVAWFHFSLAALESLDHRRTQRIIRRIKGFTHVVVICEAMRQQLQALCPQVSDKITRLYNPVDAERLRTMAKETVDVQWKYIVTVGRLEEKAKDVSTLLRAYSLLDTDRHLVIVGKGPDEQRLKDLAATLGISDRVHFVGFQANPHKWVAHADLMVQSSHFEGLPNAIIEALMLGSLIVATDCPIGPREILEDGQSGILTPVGDARSMSKAIERALTDEEQRRRLLLRASHRSKDFEIDVVKGQLEKLFA